MSTLSRWGGLPWARWLALAAALGGAAMAGRAALLGGAGWLAVPAALGALALAAGAWWLGRRISAAHWALPLLPWLAGWPLVEQSVVSPVAGEQLAQSGGVVCLYLTGWLVAGLGALALWEAALRGPAGAEPV